jgi:hypothetical protein
MAHNLHSLTEATQHLGGISIWTLRKQVAQGNVKVTRIGRRLFLRTEEIERIRENGLPRLRHGKTLIQAGTAQNGTLSTSGAATHSVVRRG